MKSKNTLIDNESLSNIQFAALEAAANGIVITDPKGIVIWINKAITELTGYSKEELVGNSTRIFKSGMHDRAFYYELWRTISKGETWRGDIINRRKDGCLYHEDMTITPVVAENGEIKNYIAIKQDITQYRQMVEALRESEERFRQLINSVNAHFYVSEYTPEKDFINIYVSENIEKLTGYPRYKFLQDWTFWHQIIHPDDKELTQLNIEKLKKGESGEIEYRIVDAFGKVKWVTDNISVVLDMEGPLHLYATITDINTKKENENRIRHLATHDPLTNLPNRIMFKEILEHAISYAKRNNCRAAVFFLDVDDFKSVNDTYGHHIGDALLKSIAERLRNNLRAHDTISRIAGDEFTLVTEQLKSPENAHKLARKIHSILKGTYKLGPHTIEVDVSVGGSIFPDHGDNYDTLIRLADAAMYQAKNSPELHYAIHTPSG
jgi:diguanylate cyclase (GGDEF)-like protein/PAS domain S-box-containing protein